jgi:hypothetical protein
MPGAHIVERDALSDGVSQIDHPPRLRVRLRAERRPSGMFSKLKVVRYL